MLAMGGSRPMTSLTKEEGLIGRLRREIGIVYKAHTLNKILRLRVLEFFKFQKQRKVVKKSKRII